MTSPPVEPGPGESRYRFDPMTPEVARAIDGWRSPGQYAFYDLDADPEDRAAFLDEPTWPDRRFAVRDADGLAGVVSVDEERSSVVFGLGMAPDRTGQGEGEAFVRACLAFARGRFDADEVRLSVAAFDGRATRAYERCGFRRVRER